MARAHTLAAALAIALIPCVPLGLWLYTKAASVDRGAATARNERVFRSVPHMAGWKLLAAYSYALHRWDVGDGLSPVVGYRTEFFVRLPRRVGKASIRRHYERVFRSWDEPAPLEFVRGGVSVRVDVAEQSQSRRTVSGYGVYVSQ